MNAAIQHGNRRYVVARLVLTTLIGLIATFPAQADFEQCKANLKDRARAEGIDPSTINHVLDAVDYNAKVIELDQRQPEFTRSFGNYYHLRVTTSRVAIGRALLATHIDLLQRVRRQTGVPPHYLVAFWGLETNFGNIFGNMSVPDSLTTLACDPRRSEFFSAELMNALRIIEAGDVEVEKMRGSWAGAMGHVQFMPSAYLNYAVDGDGDGRRDLWGSIPDAMFSAGNFLQQLGWQPGIRWGREVILPDSFDYALANTGKAKPLNDWRKLGIKDVFGQPLAKSDIATSLLVPSGHKGPAFVTYQNFDVIMRWNRSEYYALSVGRLADRIAGAGKLRNTPPDADLKLSNGLVLQLQENLNTLGYDAGEPDGVPGPMTRSAVSRYQQSKGVIADGYLDATILEAIDKDVSSE
uniref:Translycolase-related protein n=1 Tax=uncultured bacterium pES01019D12 TaxID=355333 RepID=A0EJL3_9BACT|nr:translycolase-related protein [uncultured bacterium pES01019D12]